ncbi:hypothetical protein [Acinetobacter towneri]|jgi:hypothetical protein|uniref:hypothetical protein n=1 Tax=Acinetobacter towneri TaxID=202956 RepID=UPI002B25C3E8|nr:hypothetical protein [Acinetobacter towneri]WPC33539.1 hypothetical protein O4J62_14160 [Acinetobacter towneri]
MTATGSNTSNKFKAARQNKEFVQDVNSDAADSAPKQITITSRNKSQVTLEPNTLSQRERSRVKNGRNLTIPLFAEELLIIEAAVESLSQKEDISINAFIRNLVLDKCKKVIGKEAFDELNDRKLNVIKAKKDK